jgi:hypothetical protein
MAAHGTARNEYEAKLLACVGDSWLSHEELSSGVFKTMVSY